MEATPRGSRGAGEKSIFTVLVTGANSGLGFAICCRLIDDFLYTRPQSQAIHILFSTRDAKKAEQTLKQLNAHLQRTLRATDGRTAHASLLLEARVKLEGVSVDLTQLATVKALANELLERGGRIDALVCNAGIGGWTGFDWPRTLWQLGTDFLHASTYPTYQISGVGAVTARQTTTTTPTTTTTAGASEPTSAEPPLGQVFTANVFGHYLLAHWLAPLMAPESRIVWLSSTTAHPHHFSLHDLQRLRATEAYESSKRLTDLLVLTSELPSTRPYVAAFLPAASAAAAARPKMYLTHPGIVSTSIAGLPALVAFFMTAAFYLARLLGSPWHTVSAHKGAVSAVWACLAPDEQLPDRERREGKGKWGSVVDVSGAEHVKRTDVDGWGFCGELGVVPSGSVSGPRGKYRGARPLTKELREEFEDTGRQVWRELEEMRKEWEQRLLHPPPRA